MIAEKENYKYNYVMLIDDAPLDNFINEKLIRSQGFSKEVYITSSASSALEFLNNLALTGEAYPYIFPAVIFVDINMPIVDGFEFILEFRKTLEKQLRKLKLVILTSSVFEGDKIRTEELSEEIIFLNKPLTKEMLDRL